MISAGRVFDKYYVDGLEYEKGKLPNPRHIAKVCYVLYYCRITLHWSGRNEADMIRLWCIEQGVSCGWWGSGHVVTILASDWLLCRSRTCCMLAAVLHTCCVLQTVQGACVLHNYPPPATTSNIVCPLLEQSRCSDSCNPGNHHSLAPNPHLNLGQLYTPTLYR